MLLIVAITATGGVAGTPTWDAAAMDGHTPDSADNETVYHQNPHEIESEPDTAEVDRWMAEELASGLEVSASELRDGDPDRAQAYLDGEYDELLDQYVEVTDEDVDIADMFEEAGDEQAELIATLEAYRETAQAYEQAREEGDEERSRELARELEDLAETIEESEDTLQVLYGSISGETAEELSEGQRSLAELEGLVQEGQATVREAEFVETELDLEPESENVSFLEALSVTGQLRTEDGSPVADESIELTLEGDVDVDVGDGAGVETETRNATFETDGDGTFEFEYRPTDRPLATDELTVEYVPEDDSVYLASEATVDVSVEQVETSISDLEAPDEVAYGENVTVEGVLTAGDDPVSDVPLEVILAGEHLGTATPADGSFEHTVEIPRAVPAGDGGLEVSLPFENRALAGTDETVTVTVRETETDLSVNATALGNESVQVGGTFETADGEAIGNESIQIRLGETPLGSTTTDGDGELEETMIVPSSEEGTVSIVAAYDGGGSNLVGGESETTVELRGSGTWWGTTLSLTWLSLLAVVVTVLAVGRWWQRRLPATPAASGADSRTVPGDRPPDPSVTRSLLSRADGLLSRDRPGDAVRTSYAAVRQRMRGRIDGDDTLTHWEFYRQCRRHHDGVLEGEDDRFLRDVIEGYERTTFDATGVHRREAEWILECARRLCTLESEQGDPSTADD
ncbi:hypothetical protein ACYJ1Y_02145 [Natrialbaceae archaeon A-gly3]